MTIGTTPTEVRVMRQELVAIFILLLTLGAVVSGKRGAMYPTYAWDWPHIPAEGSPPHNVTLTVEDHEVLFLGLDVWGHAETYSPHLLSNQTASELMGQYNQSLLFLQHTEVQEEQEANGTTTYPFTRFDAFVAMNESCFTQALFSSHYGPNSTDNWPHPDIVDSMQVFSGIQYVDTLKTALSCVIRENLTRNLNVISWEEPVRENWPPVFVLLWSSNYTGHSFWFSDSPLSAVLWRHSDADSMLARLHWELRTEATYRLWMMKNNRPIEYAWYDLTITTVFSVAFDGNLIQMQRQVLIGEGDPSSQDYLSMLILGTGVAVGIVALVVFYKRREI